jgi:hypothetical protein
MWTSTRRADDLDTRAADGGVNTETPIMRLFGGNDEWRHAWLEIVSGEVALVDECERDAWTGARELDLSERECYCSNPTRLLKT